MNQCDVWGILQFNGPFTAAEEIRHLKRLCLSRHAGFSRPPASLTPSPQRHFNLLMLSSSSVIYSQVTSFIWDGAFLVTCTDWPESAIVKELLFHVFVSDSGTRPGKVLGDNSNHVLQFYIKACCLAWKSLSTSELLARSDYILANRFSYRHFHCNYCQAVL